MDREMKITEFTTALEIMSSEILKMIYQVEEPCLNILVSNISEYMHKNYPFVDYKKDDILNAIYKVYQKKDMNLKKAIDTNIGLLKYNLEDNNVDVDLIIKEEINKYKTLFMSVNAGTNASYLGLVDEITENVMSLLIRSNHSIYFAKDVNIVREYMYDLVNKSFVDTMLKIGDTLLDDGILRVEADFENKDNIKMKELK